MNKRAIFLLFVILFSIFLKATQPVELGELQNIADTEEKINLQNFGFNVGNFNPTASELKAKNLKVIELAGGGAKIEFKGGPDSYLKSVPLPGIIAGVNAQEETLFSNFKEGGENFIEINLGRITYAKFEMGDKSTKIQFNDRLIEIPENAIVEFNSQPEKTLDITMADGTKFNERTIDSGSTETSLTINLKPKEENGEFTINTKKFPGQLALPDEMKEGLTFKGGSVTIDSDGNLYTEGTEMNGLSINTFKEGEKNRVYIDIEEKQFMDIQKYEVNSLVIIPKHLEAGKETSPFSEIGEGYNLLAINPPGQKPFSINLQENNIMYPGLPQGEKFEIVVGSSTKKDPYSFIATSGNGNEFPNIVALGPNTIYSQEMTYHIDFNEKIGPQGSYAIYTDPQSINTVVTKGNTMQMSITTLNLLTAEGSIVGSPEFRSRIENNPESTTIQVFPHGGYIYKPAMGTEGSIIVPNPEINKPRVEFSRIEPDLASLPKKENEIDCTEPDC